MDQDQARHDVGPDLDPTCLTLPDGIIERIFFQKAKMILKIKKSADDKNIQNYPVGKEQEVAMVLSLGAITRRGGGRVEQLVPLFLMEMFLAPRLVV